MTTHGPDERRAAIRRNLEQHPDWDFKRRVGALKRWRVTIRELREATGKAKPATGKAAAPPAVRRPGTVSLADLKARWDIMGAIRREIAKLRDGEPLPEAELRTAAAGGDAARFRRALDADPAAVERLRVRLKLDSNEARWYYGRERTVAEAAALRDR
jgi:hypothetical protein